MIEFDYEYKYLKLSCNNTEIIIALSLDNSMKEITYAAKSNLLFKDQEGDWGHACGVGSSENEALQMCLNEICNYINCDLNSCQNLQVLNITKKITLISKNKTFEYLIKENNKNTSILTNDEIISINKDIDIVNYFTTNFKFLKDKGINQISKKKLLEKKFLPVFDLLYSKYNSEEDLSL